MLVTQLSLFTENAVHKTPTQAKAQEFFCDVFVHSCEDGKKKRIRIKPLMNQTVDSDLFVSCSQKARRRFPVGTIFKLDLRLAYSKNGKKYLKAIAGKPLQRALEYFEHNLALQKAVNEKSRIPLLLRFTLSMITYGTSSKKTNSN